MTETADTIIPFLKGNYAPVADELTAFDLPVEGSIPAELDGWYLRNGPNPRKATGHWFTGDGMVHGVRLENGRAAWYRNRWVRTESFERPFPVYERDGTRNLHSSVGEHTRRPPRRQDPRPRRVVPAVRDHQRTRDALRLRLRGQARRFDDRASQDLPDDGRAALLRIRQPDRPARDVPPCRRVRRAHDQPWRGGRRVDDDARLRPHGPARDLHGSADRVQHRRRVAR